MNESLEARVSKRIDRKRGDVFLRSDFSDLGGYDQVGRALRQLVRRGSLFRISQGLYARARPSLLDGKPIPVRGLATLTAALARVGIETVPSRLTPAYNAGRTTQVPTGRVVGVKRRVRRRIGYNEIYLSFERVGPAPR
jgi:hypothetical protein